MNTIFKKWLASSVVVSILLVPVLPASAASNSFGVLLSSYSAGEKSTVEFAIETETNTSFKTDGVMNVQFPTKWTVPSDLDENDVLLNGVKPKDVTVSKQTVSIVTPSGVNGDNEVIVEFLDGAGLTNPADGGNYTIKTAIQLNEKYLISGKQRERVSTKYINSDTVTIENATTGNDGSSGGGTTNPHPLPGGEFIGPKQSAVVVRVGSTVGFYQKIGARERVTQKVGMLSAAPYLSKGNTMIPFKFVADGLGALLTYDKTTGIVGVFIDNKYMEFKAGEKTAVVNGESVEMPIAPEIKNDQMMLPLRFAVEKMGANLKWFNATQTILITRG